jgi:hypothetical protein
VFSDKDVEMFVTGDMPFFVVVFKNGEREICTAEDNPFDPQQFRSGDFRAKLASLGFDDPDEMKNFENFLAAGNRPEEK